MSSLACGAHIVLDGPPPVERVHTLLTVPGVLVGKEEHWESGIDYFAYPTEVPTPWTDEYSGTFRTKADGGTPPTPSFEPVTLYLPVSCTASGMTPAEFEQRAGEVLRVTQAYGVEHALAAGIPGQVTTVNPFLSDGNMATPAGSTAISARVALSYLEEALAATGRGGVIHVTPAVMAALEPICRRDDYTAPIYTGAGTPIAVGTGYSGVRPVGEAAPGTTQDWIYVSGPVEVRIDDAVTLPEIGDALDHQFNDVTYRAEKVAVVSWDTALQAGVLVDWSLCCGDSSGG